VNFSESESYLLSLGNEVEAMKLGLENIRTLLNALGEPQNKYLKVQVAGTNGKGSVCAFLDAICRSANINAGVFTSPHLVSITERIRIGGLDIRETDFARFATVVRETSEKLLAEGSIEYRPTFFEQMTAIALVAFAEAKVELAILETGLGGRLDATTAANAEIAAITRIDLDHQEYLGDTIEEIAAEKAAIIRPDAKVVLAHQLPDVERVIVARCRELNVEPNWATDDIETKSFDPGSSGPFRRSIFRTRRQTYPEVVLSLLGEHQLGNAAVAIGLAEALQDLEVRIFEMDIWAGLGSAFHPGRIESDGEFLFDGAHNPAGAKSLRRFLDEFVESPITMIFGAMTGKDVSEIAAILFPKAEYLILTQPANPRAMTAKQLIEYLPADLKTAGVTLTGSVSEAINAADKLVSPDGIILVTGSLYLVGEAKKILNN